MALSRSQEQWRGLLQQAEADLAHSTTKPSNTGALDLDASAIAGSIDHTLLKLDATSDQIDQLCAEAKQYSFKAVCVRLAWVEKAVHNLRGTPVVVACVVGFHEGTYTSQEKGLEAKLAVESGAKELDMVIDHVWLREKHYQQVLDDIGIVRAAAPRPVILKVILETSVLSNADIIAGCKIAEIAQADFVKTSTGFNGQGATVGNVRLMKAVVGKSMKVKASGGVRTMTDLKTMLEAGADRIGASSGVAIINEAGTQHRDVQKEVVSGGTEPHSQSQY